MKRGHLAALRPVCPVCRAASVEIGTVVRESHDDVLEGILNCPNPECLREYPIVDGIPILVAAIRSWLSANPLQLLQRTDLSPELESLLGDALGPNSPFDTLRQHVGIYAADHYEGDSAVRLLSRELDAGDGPVIDIGCSVGGTTFALGSRFERLTVGVDLNFAMLRLASDILRTGRASYSRRRVGLAYDRRELDLDLPHRELVDFWCCDAAALPFASETFGFASVLNLIDCVATPGDVVAECARVLRAGGNAIVSTPYDWTPSATPVEQWLGGHSQRGANRGAAEPMLRALLARHFDIVAEEENVPWRVRVHERSTMEYLVHVVVAARRSAV